MTRHAKNCTAGAVYTYHEKQKDTKTCGYGTQKDRIGKDSVKDFDCCCLTLQPCHNPVVTPQGFLYDKEAILEYVIHKKKEIAKQLKEYERQKKKEEQELLELAKAEQASKAETFLKDEKNFTAFNDEASTSKQSICNMKNGNEKVLPSFWIPSLTPEAKKCNLKKPDSTVYCPMSGKPLKIKDLVPIQFMIIQDSEPKSLIARKARYKCAVTHDVLSNSIPCAVLKTSGSVVTVECVEKIIKKEMIDPINGKKLTEKDIIYLQRGGTGYSSTNKSLKAEIKKPVMMA
ncbi:nitric oxide synthase-interacting protein isoform X2 [Centruroides vittatus]|uniref:nitric oxide synthase-interacting protein isoform X2 n=1 Tax=Centruroides vittatus TaxID=120091 RepID=UPI00350F6856